MMGTNGQTAAEAERMADVRAWGETTGGGFAETLAALIAAHVAEVDAARQDGWHAGLVEGRAQGRATALVHGGLPPEVERAAIAAGKADRRARPALVNGGPPTDALDDGR